MDCIEWTGSKSPKGYGITRHNGKRQRAHRVAYCTHNEVSIDSIKGFVIRHTCDNPGCVNPYHLLIGDNNDNMQDKVARGRQARIKILGERNGQAKLTDAQVAEIRALYVPRSSEFGGHVLAKKFGVGQQAISKIVTNARRVQPPSSTCDLFEPADPIRAAREAIE